MIYNRGDTKWSQWVHSEKGQPDIVMERYGIEWEDKDIYGKHLSALNNVYFEGGLYVNFIYNWKWTGFTL